MKTRLNQIDRSHIILGAILLLSVGLRVGSALYLGNTVVVLPGTFDQLSYHTLALRLISGHGFTFGETWWPFTAADAPTAHWSFLYTFFLTFIYSLFGQNPIVARIIQAVIVGILHPLLIFLIGKRVFNEPVGLIGAALSTVYVYFVYYTGALMTEPFYITAVLGSLYLALWINDVQESGNRRFPWWAQGVVFGLVLGTAVLLRQLFLLVIPFIYLWLLWAGWKDRLRATLRIITISVVTVIVMIIPFTIYNYSRFDRIVLLNTNSGYAFFWSNHPVYGTQFESLLPEELGTYNELVPQELRHLDEAALEQALLKLGVQFVIDDPIRYIKLSISRIPIYFNFWPSADSSALSNIARMFTAGMYLFLSFYALLQCLTYLFRRSAIQMNRGAILLLGFAFVYTMIHVLSWTQIRYRLPVDAVMLLFAAYGAYDLVRKLKSQKHASQDSIAIRQP